MANEIQHGGEAYEVYDGWQTELADAESKAFLQKTANILSVVVASSSRTKSAYQHAIRSVSGLPAYRLRLRPQREQPMLDALGTPVVGMQIDVPKGLIIGDFDHVLAAAVTLQYDAGVQSFFVASDKCVSLQGIRDVVVDVQMEYGVEHVFISGNKAPQSQQFSTDEDRLGTVELIHKAMSEFRLVRIPLTDDNVA